MSTVPAAPSPLSKGSGARAKKLGGSSLAHGAFWLMVRRVTLVAAGVCLALLVLFLLLGSPLLAWINIAGIALYAGAYRLVSKRMNGAAIVLIWIEVLGHAAIGSLWIGWDSGFHYYLLMFIPALVLSSRNGYYLLLMALLMFYLGLHTVCRYLGPLQALSESGLAIVHGFNVIVVFAMASSTARFYYTNVRRAERKLVEMATRDPLTGLANRRHFVALAQHEIARAGRSGEALTLVIADIDHFKRINDQHGHETGDLVLREVAEVLSRLCRAQDVVARWGGEEFLMLLPGASAEAASGTADRIRTALAATAMAAVSPPIALTLSLGVATLARGEDLSRAIARADQALYQSKAQGRNRVSVAA